MRVTPEGYLYHAYYGERLPEADLSYYNPDIASSCNTNIPGTKRKTCYVLQEYATPYLGDFREPALSAVDARGNRAFALKYDSYEILTEKPAIRSGIPMARGGETLKITLKDDVSGLTVYLFYTVYEDEDIITRRAETVNTTAGAIHLERALSITLDFYDCDFEMITYQGRHNGERYPQVSRLIQGRVSVGNIRGTSSHHHAPLVVLRRPGADEENGEVYAASLTYSGSHYDSVEVDESFRARLSMGINPESFDWKLEPGESFETPEAVLCYKAYTAGNGSAGNDDVKVTAVISNEKCSFVWDIFESIYLDRDTRYF